MSKSTGNTPSLGQEMAQFSQKNIMGVAFDTTERLDSPGVFVCLSRALLSFVC